ncbi:MAG: T9SS type A sorting domain-containing protein [Planctomycetia bacterium]|nr:T9SS type A sorting domain-containing protein [Planctomycetia bacterium]
MNKKRKGITMNKNMLLSLLIIVLFQNLVLADIPVTWQVDMTVKTAEAVFTPGVDNVTLRGGFMDELGLSGDWFPDEGPYVLSDDDQDTVYSITLDFPDSLDGTYFEYKYQINDDVWESGDNHNFTLSSPTTVLPVEYFDNDSVVTILSVTTLNFRLDLTSFYGSGLGYFDPATDSIKIEGFWGDGIAEELSDASARWCVENIWQPGFYETQITIKAEEGKIPEFKAHAFPEDHFENWGWELYDNHTFTVGADSATINIEYVPDILPQLQPLSEDVTILFAVDMSNAVNRWNQELIDPTTLTHVGLKGQNEMLGAWAGTWELSDTTAGSLLMLNNNGVNGDVTADDNIWSVNVLFPAGITGGPSLYKYSAYYPGSDTLPSFDNEMTDQDDNHQVIIEVGGVTVLDDIFNVPSLNGEPEVSINDQVVMLPEKSQLHQNYPNPFNPTTQISFELPNNDYVKIVVYNVLGRQVETLINRNMNTGYHTVTFNGYNYASGVYFVQMVTPNNMQVRKIMLLK